MFSCVHMISWDKIWIGSFIIALFVYSLLIYTPFNHVIGEVHLVNSTIPNKDYDHTERNSDNTSLGTSHMDFELNQRVENLRKTCSSLHVKSPGYGSNLYSDDASTLYADDHRKLLICLPPKAGSTLWKRSLGLSSGRVTADRIQQLSSMVSREGASSNPSLIVHRRGYMGLVGLKDLTRAVAAHDLYYKDYFKVIVVRDPYVRLVSAFQDKILPGIRQIKSIAHNITKIHQLNDTADVTFEDFISYLSQVSMKSPNIHISTYHRLCSPCDIQYDFIVSVENLRDDNYSSYISNRILNTTSDFLRDRHQGPYSATYNHTSSALKAKSYYCSLSDRSKSFVKEYLMLDCLLFGYDSNAWFQCSEI